MSVNHHSVLQRLTRLALCAASTAAVATGAFMISPASPAEAATTFQGCTITPTTPTAASSVGPTGETLVDYRGGVWCPLGKLAEVQRERWEQDAGPDNWTGTSASFVYAPLWWDQQPLPDTDGSGSDYEQVYQRVRFRVFSNGVTSAWSAWELTSAVSIRQ